MSSKIRILDDATINKIAAGEVVENAASVVKELVENSLDAQAQEITIEIKTGGRQLIRITDDGSGMSEDDALLCIERHATSKIRKIEDIFSTSTMGFRGEALPSICAISKFTLITCERGAKEGSLIIIEGGKILKCDKAIRSPGTTIEVKELFFNIPVRRKFQKSPSYDEGEVVKVVSKLSLANPDVKFHLISDHKTIFLTTKAPSDLNASHRISEILGKNFIKETVPLHYKKNEITIEGFLGKPSFHRSNRTGQYLFINKRPVHSPFISFAVTDAYGMVLPPRRHPVFVLYMTLPTDVVDVNVHPQKREVRLSDEATLREIIHKAVKKSFIEEIPLSLSLSPSSFDQLHVSAQDPFFTYEQVNIPSFSNKTIKDMQEPELFPFSSTTAFPKFTVIATFARYFLAQQRDEVVIIDSSKAHARILFETLHKKLEVRTNEIQEFIIPYTLELLPVEVALIKEHLLAIIQLGFRIREFGKNTFIIEGAPLSFANKKIEKVFPELLQELKKQKGKENDRDAQLAVAVAKAKISLEHKLSLIEAQALVDALVRCDNFQKCPKGTSLFFPLDLEAMISNKGSSSSNEDEDACC